MKFTRNCFKLLQQNKEKERKQREWKGWIGGKREEKEGWKKGRKDGREIMGQNTESRWWVL